MTAMSSSRHLHVIYPELSSRSRRGGSKEQRRILIVEDEARIRAFLARAFEAEGFGVDVVGDGELGLARALAGQYDLVILDLMLPGLSGLEALRELHRQKA